MSNLEFKFINTVYALGENESIRNVKGKLGGGDVLVKQDEGFKYTWYNEGVIKQFEYLPYVKILVIALLTIMAVVMILRVIGMRSIFTGAALQNTKSVSNSIKRRDAAILNMNSFLNKVVAIVKLSGAKLSAQQREYLKYNLERANIRAYGGYRYITPDEFDSLCKLGMTIGLFFGTILLFFVNGIAGILVGLLAIIGFNTLPLLLVRRAGAAKDAEIIDSFPDLYLMIHYELMSDSGTPIANTFKSFLRINSSAEMERFINESLNLIETYGELGATTYISSRYREIPEVTRLMRLIKQQNEGGNIKSELAGFRKQIIEDKRFRLEKKVDKLVAKARASFYLTTFILVQAILSAMMIYLPDLNLNFI